MSSFRGKGTARRGGFRHRPRRDPSQSPIRRRDHSKEVNKSLDKITHALEVITTRLDALEHRSSSTRSSTPAGFKPKSSERQTLDESTRKAYDFVRLKHHAVNWESCPAAISKSISKVVRNIHPPRNTDSIRERLVAAGKEFENKITSIIQDHIETEASHIKRQLGYVSADHKQTLYTELTDLIRKQNSRISDRTLGQALSKLGTDTPDVTDEESEGAVGGIPPTPTRKRSVRINSGEHQQQQKKKHRADTTPNEDTVELLSEMEAETEQAPNSTTFMKFPKLLNRKDGWLWSLDPAPPATRTLIITDSNGKYFENRRVPHSIVTMCYPGCNIRRVNELLRNTKKLPPDLTTVIVAVGINDRQGNNDSNLNSDLQDIQHWGHTQQLSLYFAGISASNRLPIQEHTTIDHVNELIQDIFDKSYIAPLPVEQIQVDMNDMTGVHHDITTALKIFDELLKVTSPDSA